MSENIINPFNQIKKTNWAKKAEQRLSNSRDEVIEREVKEPIKFKIEESKPSKTIVRVAKSFKIYPGQIPRAFDKRVNKMQVYFDDLNKPKDYVDSGKYMMFLMSFAEKFGVHELYREVNENGEIELSEKEIKEFFNQKK